VLLRRFAALLVKNPLEEDGEHGLSPRAAPIATGSSVSLSFSSRAHIGVEVGDGISSR
jgi:hypothetical protein